MDGRGYPYPNDGGFQKSYSFGNQRSFRHIPGRNADCAQSAAGNVAGRPTMGSIDPATYEQQPLAQRSARQLEYRHGLTAVATRYYQVPPNAQGICYFNWRVDNWHFGRFEQGCIVHADESEMERPGMGGTFMVFPPDLNGRVSLNHVTGQRGVTPGFIAANIRDFVAYCGEHYDNSEFSACYYYVYFG